MSGSETRDVALATLYLRTNRVVESGLRWCKGLVDGCWLGLLGTGALHALDDRYYRGEAQYVDDDYNRSGLWPWERAIVDEEFAGCRRVVVVGAGGGREVLALLQLGVDAIGFECNPQLVASGTALLEAEGHGDRLHLVARDEWPAVTGYDGVIVGWGAYMLMPGRTRRVAFLRAARAGCAAGTPVLLSFFTRPGDTVYFRTIARVGNGIRRLRRADPLEVGDALAPNYAHFFTRQQAERELAAAGFRPTRYEDGEYGRIVGRAT